jgi:hypothetical protein
MVFEMTFDNDRQLARWLELNTLFEYLGELESELPTRHVRMQKENNNDSR